MPDLPTGRALGSYVLVEQIGSGGFGEVWKAWDTKLSRWVALKLLREENPEELQRFFREARLAAAIVHPGIVPIHEVGNADGRHFIAMQLVEGASLADHGPLHPREAVRIIVDVARAVDYAHERGVVHRDLKPSNILRDPEGRVFVTDFGLAKRVKAGALSASSVLVGTPDYMSPEQARGSGVDRRSDVWSLGATLYALLEGRAPFAGPSALDIMIRAASEPPPPLESVERDLAIIVMKCLEKDPAMRYPTAGELAADLQRCLAGEPINARAPSVIYRLRKRVAKNRTLTITGIAAAVLAVGALVVVGVYRAKLRGAEESLLLQLRQSTDAYLEAALAARRAGDLERMDAYAEKVATVCSDVIARSPALAEPHHRWGRMLRALLRFDEAREKLDEAVRRDPGNEDARYERGVTRLALWGDRMAAIRVEIRRREALLVAGQRGLVKARATPLIEYEDAGARTLRLGAAEDLTIPGAAAAALRSFALLEERAWEHLLEAARLSPVNVDLWRHLGEMAFANRDAIRAVELHSEAATRDRGFLPCRLGRAEALIYLSRGSGEADERNKLFDAGIADLDDVVRMRPRVAAFRRRRADALGRWAGSLDVLRLKSDDTWARAFADADEAIRLSPADSEGYITRAQLAVDDLVHSVARGGEPGSRLDGAIADLQRAVELGGSAGEIATWRSYAWLVLASHRAGRGEPADEIFERAVKQAEEATRASPRSHLAWFRSAEARELWVRHRKYRGEQPIELHRAAIADYDEALRVSEIPITYVARGVARLNWERGLASGTKDPAATLQPALKDFDRGLELDPGMDEARFSRGETNLFIGSSLLQRGQDPTRFYEAALVDLDVARTKMPHDGRVALARAGVHASWASWQMGRNENPTKHFEAALADFDAAVSLGPSNDVAWANRGFIRGSWIAMLLSTRPVDRAKVEALADGMERDFAEALKLNPGNPDTWYRRGRSRMTTGNFQGAIDDLEESVRRNPRMESIARPMIEQCKARQRE